MDATDLLTDSEPVLRDWLMKRNCSVSPRQFVCFYMSLAAFSLLIALVLVLRGAWLVLPFTGIDLLAVGVAFAIYARHAVDYERIRLFRTGSSSNRSAPSGSRSSNSIRAGCGLSRAQRRGTASSWCRVERRSRSGCIWRSIGARSSPTSCVCGSGVADTASRAVARRRGTTFLRGRGFEWKFWVRKL